MRSTRSSGRATDADYRKALDDEISITWRLMHRYRRLSHRGDTLADFYRKAAADARAALVVLLMVRAIAHGRG